MVVSAEVPATRGFSSPSQTSSVSVSTRKSSSKYPLYPTFHSSWPKPECHVASSLGDFSGKSPRVRFIASPAAPVRGQLPEADDLCHERPDHGAAAGSAGLDRGLPAVDPLHDLHLARIADLVGVAVPFLFLRDEECRVAAVAIGGLDHQVAAEFLRDFLELLVGTDPGKHIWNAVHPRPGHRYARSLFCCPDGISASPWGMRPSARPAWPGTRFARRTSGTRPGRAFSHRCSPAPPCSGEDSC